MAVGTGFGVLWRGVGSFIWYHVSRVPQSHTPAGQVGGVAVSSAIFQSRLDSQLRRRITGPNADEVSRLLLRGIGR